MNSKEIIDNLQLVPHPEGGYYKETYRSGQMMTLKNETERNLYTVIYYLLENEDRSTFHRIKSDELWFFHQGEPLEIAYIKADSMHKIALGNSLENGEAPQINIEANMWFAAKIKKGKGYSLVSCTVAPGFDFKDFELAEKGKLIQEYPHLKEMIEAYS